MKLTELLLCFWVFFWRFLPSQARQKKKCCAEWGLDYRKALGCGCSLTSPSCFSTIINHLSNTSPPKHPSPRLWRRTNQGSHCANISLWPSHGGSRGKRCRWGEGATSCCGLLHGAACRACWTGALTITGLHQLTRVSLRFRSSSFQPVQPQHRPRQWQEQRPAW